MSLETLYFAMKTLRWPIFILLVAGVAIYLWLLWLEQSFDPPYSFIENGLYLGKAVEKPPPGTNAVVNLCGRPDPYSVEESLWEPVFEGGAEPDLAWLRRIVDFIANQRKADRTVYVHCLAGMNRSSAAVTAYLMAEHGWSRDQALAFVREKRPIIQPNPTMMKLLGEWESTLRDGKSH